MTMHESEKNFLEKIADAIPGISGYREKERRRDTDKRLREYIGDQIDRIRNSLSSVTADVAGQGQLDNLDDLDKLGRRLQQSADSIRFASYGYAGFLDAVKIKEAELDDIYRFDSALLDSVDSIRTAVAELDPSALTKDALRGFDEKIKGLEEKIADRKNIFNTPV